MFNRKFMLMAIFLVGLLAISVVSASEINDTDDAVTGEIAIDEIEISEYSNDVVSSSDEDCVSVNEGTFTDLQNLIDNASSGSTISLQKDYVHDEGFDVKGIVISKDLTIEGNGHILNALSKSMIFNLKGTLDFTVNDVKFFNGYSKESGGAICANDGGLMGDDFTINVNKCTFENNTARYGGGAIDCQSLEVMDSIFINNKGFDENLDGGAIYVFNNIVAQNCNFINNSAEYGGVLYIHPTDSSRKIYNIVKCNFTNNKASKSGGAIYSFGDESLTNITSCIFNSNNAEDYAGSVYCCGLLVIDNSEFNTNSAFRGGAIYHDGSSTTSTRGGDYLYSTSYQAVIFNSKFNYNHAPYGGSIYSNDYDGNALDVIKCAFIGNSAAEGGTICYADAFNCSFVNNSAEREGGAIYSGGAVDCSFIGNLAEDGDGGVIYNGSAVRCSFVNNSAGDDGGAIYMGDASNCSFVSNSARYGGGAICQGLAMNCNFTDNSASGGGAINHVSAVNCNFIGNSAGDGGAIDSGSAVNCNFINNSANQWGGAFYDPINIEKCTFINNVANSSPIFCLYEIGHYSYYNIENVKITGCNISKSELNDYGSVNLKGNILRVEMGEINNGIVVKISGKTLYPSYTRDGYDYTASFDLSGIAFGIYDVQIDYSGDSDHSPVNIVLPVYVGPQISISAEDVDMYCGGSQKFIATLKEGDSAISGKQVNITIDGKTSTVITDSKGRAIMDLNQPVGEYDVIAVYEGVSNTSKVTVKSTLTVSNATGTYSNSKVGAAFLNTEGKALASKQVTFKVNGRDYTATTNGNGVAAANIDLNVGTYTVTAVNPLNNEQKEFNLVINKAGSNVSLAYSQSGEATRLTATLMPTTATGSVIFNVNGENKTAVIKSGKATLTLSDLKAGNYTVTAFYNGDNNLNASISDTVTFSVADAYPVLTAKGVTKTYGTSTKLVVYLKDNKGNAIANAKVNVTINSKVTTITTNSDGQATMAISQAPGTYDAKITYPGAKDITAKIVVKKATPKITAKAKTFKKSVKTKKYTITLKVNNNAMKSTKVTIKVNKKTYSAKTNSKGQATFKITKLTKKGKYAAIVKYAGSKYYNAKSAKVQITVK